MGVSSLVNRTVYAGNGSSTAFSFPYYFFLTTDLMVFLYDTVAGGATLQVLGTNYSISGTPNFQGIYPIGANVVMSVAPASTAYLVIVRNPPENQNFNILENGIIPSSTLIQQFDYLTLLIQRLEDQVSRAIALNDGTGATFNPLLPSNIALNPLALLQVNAAGNGLQLTPNGAWSTVVIPYTSVQTGSNSNPVLAFTLPAGAVLTGIVIKHSQNFGGTGITAVSTQTGIVGNYTKFIPFFDVYQSVSDTAWASVFLDFISSWVTPLGVYVNFNSTGGLLSALSQGSLTVYYQYQIV